METIANYRYAQEVFFAIERDKPFEFVKHRYLKCLYEGEVADNPFDESSGWPEKVPVFLENIGRSLKVDVSLDAFRVFVKQQRGLSIRLFRLSLFSKRLKLLVKALLARGRQMSLPSPLGAVGEGFEVCRLLPSAARLLCDCGCYQCLCSIACFLAAVLNIYVCICEPTDKNICAGAGVFNIFLWFLAGWILRC